MAADLVNGTGSWSNIATVIRQTFKYFGDAIQAQGALLGDVDARVNSVLGRLAAPNARLDRIEDEVGSGLELFRSRMAAIEAMQRALDGKVGREDLRKAVGEAVAELEGELRDGMREVEDDLGKRVTRGELERAMKTVASMGQVENLVETRINLRFTEEEVTAIKTTLRDLSTSYASHSERIASEVAELQSQRRAAAALLDDLKQAVGSCVRRAELEDRLVEERLREGETVRKAMQTAEEARDSVKRMLASKADLDHVEAELAKRRTNDQMEGILVRIEDVLSGSARLTWVEEELSIRPTRGDVSLALDSKVDRTEMSAELANKAGSLWVEARLRDRIAETDELLDRLERLGEESQAAQGSLREALAAKADLADLQTVRHEAAAVGTDMINAVAQVEEIVSRNLSGLRSEISRLQRDIARKANDEEVVAALARTADRAEVESLRLQTTHLDRSLNAKADVSAVASALGARAEATDLSLRVASLERRASSPPPPEKPRDRDWGRATFNASDMASSMGESTLRDRLYRSPVYGDSLMLQPTNYRLGHLTPPRSEPPSRQPPLRGGVTSLNRRSYM